MEIVKLFNIFYKLDYINWLKFRNTRNISANNHTSSKCSQQYANKAYYKILNDNNG